MINKKETFNFRKLIFLFLLAGTVFACVKEKVLDHHLAGSALTVVEAQQWYESHKGKTGVEFRSEKNEKTVKLHPKWNHSSSGKNNKYDVVEAAIAADSPFNLPDEASLEKYKETEDERYLLTILAW